MIELNLKEQSAIKDNNLDYFEKNIKGYSEAKKEALLNAALVKTKIPTIMFFLDHGVKVINNGSLINLMKLKKKADFLQSLESKGVSLTEKGHILLFNACMENNAPFAHYLASKILALDTRPVVLSLANLVEKYSSLSQVENILDMLLLKLSPEKVQEIFKEAEFYGFNKEFNEAFLQKKILAHSIAFNCPASTKPLLKL